MQSEPDMPCLVKQWITIAGWLSITRAVSRMRGPYPKGMRSSVSADHPPGKSDVMGRPPPPPGGGLPLLLPYRHALWCGGGINEAPSPEGAAG